MTQHPHNGVSYGEGVRILTLRRPFAPLALAATLLVAFILVFAWPQSAAAHDQLVDSTPAADSTIENLPEELTLTFSAALISGEGSTAVLVQDADGNSVTEGEPTVDGAMVKQPLAESTAEGQYHVVWRVVSSDGHETDGQYCFSVAAEAESASTSSPAPCVIEAATAPEAESSSPAAGWMWPLSIAGIVLFAGLAAWIALRHGRVADAPDSNDDTER